MGAATRDRVTVIDEDADEDEADYLGTRTPSDVSGYLDAVATDLRSAGYVPGSLVRDFYESRGRHEAMRFPPVLANDPVYIC
jgi:hypothetical protein